MQSWQLMIIGSTELMAGAIKIAPKINVFSNKSLLCLASAFSIGRTAYTRAILRVPKFKVETSHFNSREFCAVAPPKLF
jgi:hypothetical protein